METWFLGTQSFFVSVQTGVENFGWSGPGSNQTWSSEKYNYNQLCFLVLIIFIIFIFSFIVHSLILVRSSPIVSLSFLSLSYFPSLFLPYCILFSHLYCKYFLAISSTVYSILASFFSPSFAQLFSYCQNYLTFFLLCFPIFSSFIYCNVISYFFSSSSRFSHIFSIYGVSSFVSSRWFLTKLSSGGYGNSKPGSCPPTYGREVVLSLVTYVVTLVW